MLLIRPVAAKVFAFGHHKGCHACRISCGELSLCHWAVGSGVEQIAEAVLNGTASDYYVRLYG